MEQKQSPIRQLLRNIDVFDSRICIAYYEFPRGAHRRTDQPPLMHISVPHVSSSLATSHVLIYPWATAERSDPVWSLYWGTGTTDLADLAKLGSAQLNLMSLHLIFIWQLPIIEHKIGRHGGRSWKRQCPLDKPHDDDDDGNWTASIRQQGC